VSARGWAKVHSEISRRLCAVVAEEGARRRPLHAVRHAEVEAAERGESEEAAGEGANDDGGEDEPDVVGRQGVGAERLLHSGGKGVERV